MTDHRTGGHKTAVAEVCVHGAKGVGADDQAVCRDVDAVQPEASEAHRAQAHRGKWIDTDALITALDQKGQDVAGFRVFRVDEECVRENSVANEWFVTIQPPTTTHLTY